MTAKLNSVPSARRRPLPWIAPAVSHALTPATWRALAQAGAKRALAPLAVASIALAAAADAREPTVPMAQMRPAQYAGVILLPGGDGAAVALRVGDGDAERIVPIFIGPVEAAAIARFEHGIKPPRPMTHELLGDVIAASGATLLRLVIDDLRDGVFHATLELRVGGADASVWVDARPSDGLALAVGRGVPILLGPRVVIDAGHDPKDPTPPPPPRAPGHPPGRAI